MGGHDPVHAAELQDKLRKRIKQGLQEKVGLSFEERVQIRAKAFKQEADAMQRSQQQIIEDALRRARARPSGSAVRDKHLEPPSTEQRAVDHLKKIREHNANYAKEKADREHRIRTREPLFKVSEVNAAIEEQKKRQVEYRRQLKQQEEERWAHIRELKEKVLDRPTLVEDYHRPVHSRSAPDMRLIPEYTKDTAMQVSIRTAVQDNWFLDSAWGKEVSTIKTSQDNRTPLHKIAYPPKQFAEYKAGPKQLAPIDVQLASVVSQPWFQKSQWAEQVRDIRQRQNDRPKLHEISYPPKER